MRDAIPPLSLIVAVIAWYGLTDGISRKTLRIAWALLLGPVVVMGVLEQISGLAEALRVARWSVFPLLSGVALLAATIKHIAPKPGSDPS